MRLKISVYALLLSLLVSIITLPANTTAATKRSPDTVKVHTVEGTQVLISFPRLLEVNFEADTYVWNKDITNTDHSAMYSYELLQKTKNGIFIGSGTTFEIDQTRTNSDTVYGYITRLTPSTTYTFAISVESWKWNGKEYFSNGQLQGLDRSNPFTITTSDAGNDEWVAATVDISYKLVDAAGPSSTITLGTQESGNFSSVLNLTNRPVSAPRAAMLVEDFQSGKLYFRSYESLIQTLGKGENTPTLTDLKKRFILVNDEYKKTSDENLKKIYIEEGDTYVLYDPFLTKAALFTVKKINTMTTVPLTVNDAQVTVSSNTHSILFLRRVGQTSNSEKSKVEVEWSCSGCPKSNPKTGWTRGVKKTFPISEEFSQWIPVKPFIKTRYWNINAMPAGSTLRMRNRIKLQDGTRSPWSNYTEVTIL